MSFNTVGDFVKAKSLTLTARKTGVFHRLGIDHNQACVLSVFLIACGGFHVSVPSVYRWPPQHAIVCNANKLLNTVGSLWECLPSDSHFWAGKASHQIEGDYSIYEDRFAFSWAITHLVEVQPLPTLHRLGYLNKNSFYLAWILFCSSFTFYTRLQIGSIEPIWNHSCPEIKLQTESFFLVKRLIVGANLFAQLHRIKNSCE